MSFADLKTEKQQRSVRSYVTPAPSVSTALVPTSIDHTAEAQKSNCIPAPSALTPAPDPLEHASSGTHITPSIVSSSGSSSAPTNSNHENGLYKDLPSYLEIRVSERSGRGLWTKGSTVFTPGSIILSLAPHVFTLSNPYLESHCSGCAGSPASGLKRCTGCHKVRYCDATCQNRDWSIHKLECSSLQNWAAAAPSDIVSVPSDAVRCLGRILWHIKRKGATSVWAKEIQTMQSHRKNIQPSTIEGHAHLAQSVVRYLGLSSPAELEEYGIMSTADLVDFISRFITNAVAVTSPSLTPIGVSISPLVALINHSCTPNAVVVFPDNRNGPNKQPVMKIIALTDISPGKEVFMSYVDTTLPRSLRQKALMETYNFCCQCEACTESSGVDPREAVWCPKSCGGMCPLPTEKNRIPRCASCRAAIADPDAVTDAVRIGQEALDKATHLQSKDYFKAKQLTTNIIPILLSAGLTLSTHPLLALLKLHQTLLLSSFSPQATQEYLDEMIRISGKYFAGLSVVLEEGHPLRGVSLTELGKLLAVDEPSPQTAPLKDESFPPSGPARLKAAYETHLRARKELLIGFGRDTEGGEIGQDVRKTLVSLEQELGVWKTGIRNVMEDMRTTTEAIRAE